MNIGLTADEMIKFEQTVKKNVVDQVEDMLQWRYNEFKNVRGAKLDVEEFVESVLEDLRQF